jgi:hypothetical protein
MLGVIAELDYIKVVVGTEHEMGLRPSPHFSNMLDCNDGLDPRLDRRTILT